MAFWDRVKEGFRWDRDDGRDRDTDRDRRGAEGGSAADGHRHGTDCGRGSANCGHPVRADRDDDPGRNRT